MNSYPPKILVLILTFFSLSLTAQKFTLSGYLSDSETGEKLIGASVYDKKSLKGTSANIYGYYSITLPTDTYNIVFSYVGYSKIEKKVVLTSDTELNIDLSSSSTLDEVKIVGDKMEKITETTKMGSINIPMKQIEKMPTFLGERDLIKVAQMLPGVQSSEGSSGMYVRGGGPDQNLILLDGVPVYNVSHLFGFFSVFNSDAVSNVELIKGGFPARYGGRLSSVLDIRMKEGNTKKLSGTASIGLISSKLTLEGPLGSENTSFIISGRRTYIDILAQPFIKIAARNDGLESLSAGYYFYDFNAKINHKFSNKSRLYLSAYTGKDKAYIRSKDKYSNSFESGYEEQNNKLGWGNLTTALRWNYLLTPKLFSNVTLTYSQYKFDVGIGYESEYTNSNDETNFEEFSSEYISGIDDIGLRWDIDYLPSPNHFIRFGVSNIFHKFTPGISSTKIAYDDFGESIDTTLSVGSDPLRTSELGLYLEDDMKIGDKLKVNAGIHLAAFAVDNQFYFNPQPRLAANYQVASNTSVKAGYSRMNQYIHLLTNVGIGLPTDLWVPVTDSIEPMIGNQYSIGLAQNLNNGFELSVEGYYKTMQNIIEYKDGVSFLLQADDWQNKVESGDGWAYGAEVFLQKKTGKTTGWLGYTLSWTNRQFENINFGEKFPYRYDRRHDVSFAIVHDFSKKFNMGLTWVFGTGNSVTLPVAQYGVADNPVSLSNNSFFGGNTIKHYEGRNAYRMPSYHRMDVSFNFVKQKKRGEAIWNISFYNAYNRQNPFALYFGIDDRGGQVLKQISLFPLIPSFAYTFKF